MIRPIKVKGLTIGEGIPKICVPLVGRTLQELIDEAQYVKTLGADIVEWRVDYFEYVEDIAKVVYILSDIRRILAETPFIFTFRSRREGGEKEISTEYYFELNKAIIKSRNVDFVDLELFNEETILKTLVEQAHSNDIYVIISNHDFIKTPSKDEIISRLIRGQDFGADIPKIAVMPSNALDVLTLLDATNTMFNQYPQRPLITMAMGDLGKISRISGEIFGSSITFAAAKKSSAPGQVHINELRQVLNLLHKS
jgi:3-dehydroquinate dehydratase-1